MTPKQKIALVDDANAAIAKLKEAFPEASAAPHLTAATIGLSGLRALAERQAQTAT